MNRLFSVFTGGLVGMMIVSCTGETVDYSEPSVTSPEITTPEVALLPTELPDVTSPGIASAPLSSISPETIRKFNEFSRKFYLANSENGHENLCVSPFSVGCVLGMIANGDDGAGRNEILKMLGFEESAEGLDALNTYFRTLLSNLPNIEEDIACNVTNTLWCDPFRYRIRKSFMHAITDSYFTYGIGINPRGEDGKKAINEFVGKNTKGLINEFLKSPLEVDLAFLNTLYFKAGWSRGFVEYATSQRDFLDIDGKEKETEFMYTCDWTEYAVTEDGTEAIKLNYGKNEQFSMTCVLPSSSINHIPLDEVLTSDNIKSINSLLKKEYMNVWLPKFEIETNNPKTIDILNNLGLKNRNGFGLITDSDAFFLQCFIHATKLKVDERGTEGAAVSLGGLENPVGSEDNIDHIREIVFDRPFIFYIQENTTGAILFIGSVKTFS